MSSYIVSPATCRRQSRQAGPTIYMATSFWQRLRGLLARETLLLHGSLILAPCKAVHTFGMRRPIDLVFLNRHGLVLRIVQCARPARVFQCRQASYALELRAGDARRFNLSNGARLQLVADDPNPSARSDQQRYLSLLGGKCNDI